MPAAITPENLAALANWVNSIVNPAPPEPAPDQPAPAPDTKTPEQNAQAIINKWLQWEANGAQTIEGKDEKGQTVYYPKDPTTGKADPNFPSIPEINAARELINSKSSQTPEQKAQSDATLNETLKRTELIQKQIDAAKQTAQPATVSPGEGVLNPKTGTYEIPIPKPEPASRTPEQIAAESGANVTQSNAAANASNAAAARSNAETANMQTPAQQQADRLAQIGASARASAAAAVAQKQALVDSGIELTQKDELELKAQLDQIAADAQTQRDQTLKQFEHDLAQPDVEANRAITQQTADASTQNAATNASQVEAQRVRQQQQTELESRTQQIGVLGDQAKQGQGVLDQALKAGVAPSSVLAGLAFNPLMAALQLSRQAVQSGIVPPTAIPQPSAAAPAASAMPPPTAPAPAYPVSAAPAPAPANNSYIPGAGYLGGI